MASKPTVSPVEARRSALLKHSAEALADLPQSYGMQSFILSENEAFEIGSAIHTRNHRAIQDIVGGVLNSAVEDYEATEAGECLGLWNQAFASVYGEGITLSDLLSDNDTRELLNFVLTRSDNSQLGLEATEYLKLIETIALATMPDTGFRNFTVSRQSRAGGSERALFNRSISILSGVADSEPGIRTMREDVLNTDANALSKYLSSLVRARSAQASLSMIMMLTPHDVRRQKAGIERVLNAEQTEHDLSIEDMLHVLEWRMLGGEEEDRNRKHARIKKIIEGQSKTERQRRQVVYDWCPERLDFLIEIAETAQQDGRNPKMFISNRFEEGAGVYVAVELDNPYDPEQKMLFADNPIAGNALYIVDEVRLENEGRPNDWQNVLGANRRIARERGAMRKYHTKNWQAILPKVMSMGEMPEMKVSHIPHYNTAPEEADVLISESAALRARIDALIASTRTLMQ